MLPLTRSDPAYVASYRLIGVLGGGGMGRVYLGLSRGGHRVAIKVLKEQFSDDTQYRDRFAKEVGAARLVSPLYTAAVIDADPTAKRPWLATTFVDGPSLEEWIAQRGKLDADTVLVLAAGLAEALASIHGAGLVHRDLKPGNILIDANGPHIIDFGIAMTPDSGATTANVMIGTPAYMAPERINGGPATAASDIFSLGATLYYAATGQTLVNQGTFYEQITQVALGRFNLSKVPAVCRGVIVRCIGQHATDRPTAEELSQILTGMNVARPAHGWWAAAGPLPVTQLPKPPKPSRRKVLIGGSVLSAGLLTGAVLWRPRQRTSPSAVSPSETMSVEETPPPTRVMWQHQSGAEPQPPGAEGARVLVSGNKIVAASGTTVFAASPGGSRLWTQGMPSPLLSLWQWKNHLLLSDMRKFWTLDPVTGKQIKEYPATSADSYDGVFVIDDFVIARSLSQTVAIEPSGEVCWKLSRPARAVASSATAVLMRESGRLVLRQLTNARVLWTLIDEPSTAPGTPPGQQDPAWRRSEGFFSGDFAIFREASVISSRSVSNGRLRWRTPWQAPVSDLQSFGDVAVIAADRVSAVSLDKGEQVWQYPARGARLATDPAGRYLIAAHERGLSVLDTQGRHLWTEAHPVAQPVHRVTADENGIYVTFKSTDGPDVVAYRYQL
ncbi:serine/threonine-protein kinase [Catelliglobosispora koreensis]|uniref:serine/threonine-protein kinase n=1 Tax=Catelliglobosispora koreensis TaxID=129052 RepID=UPI0012F961BE|nr:serine/threonine-protein kinase [Catelliglobosispora koreensis]